MIVKDQPSGWMLFVEMQGSVVPQIWRKIAIFTVFAITVMAVDRSLPIVPHISLTAMSVFGIALSLFLGFRNNAAYARWWDSRVLWGKIIGDVRALAKTCEIYGAKSEALLTTAAAFAHFHRGTLRAQDTEAEAAHWIGPDAAHALANGSNPAEGALQAISQELNQLHKQGEIDGFAQMSFAKIIASLARAQTMCEGIATTPLPFVYSLLIRRTTYLYCGLLPFALLEAAGGLTPLFVAVVAYVFFGLQAVTNELEHPFKPTKNGLPLDALCRVIEISVAEALGRTPQPALCAENNVLT